jgi:hypothetical protein
MDRDTNMMCGGRPVENDDSERGKSQTSERVYGVRLAVELIVIQEWRR